MVFDGFDSGVSWFFGAPGILDLTPDRWPVLKSLVFPPQRLSEQNVKDNRRQNVIERWTY